jgi:hypothetical protein
MGTRLKWSITAIFLVGAVGAVAHDLFSFSKGSIVTLFAILAGFLLVINGIWKQE